MVRLGVSENVWQCLLVSLVSCVIFGCLGVLCVIWVIMKDVSAAGPRKARLFHLTLLRHINIKTALCKHAKND